MTLILSLFLRDLSINGYHLKLYEKFLHFYAVNPVKMLKKLKSLFVVDEAVSQTVQDPNEQHVPKEYKSQERIEEFSGESPSLVTPVEGAPDPKFVDVLLKAIENANKEGFDYLEYKTSLQSLQKMDMDEHTRYKSAYAMARTLGLTKEKLLQSADHYIAILKSEEKKFKDALLNQKAKQVEDREALLKNMDKTITEKHAAIEKLKAEIETSQQQLLKVRDEISDAVQKIDFTNAQFMHALQSVLGQISEDRTRIQDYIDQ
jgi:hypothetical protein